MKNRFILLSGLILLFGCSQAIIFPPTKTIYVPSYTMTILPSLTYTITATKIIALSPTSSNTITNTLSLTIIEGTGVLRSYTNQVEKNEGYFDLDTGVKINSNESDILFSMWCGSDCFPSLDTINGAYGFIFGEKEPTFEDCVKGMKAEGFQIPGKDNYACFRTNKKNISVVIIDFPVNKNGDHWELLFRYKTWIIQN
jgi:hypothetical protein